MDSYLVKGDLCFSESKTKLKSIKNGYLYIKEGKIEGVYTTLPENLKGLHVYNYENKLIIPGLSDLHVHAPQYQFRGLWMDLELLEWLNVHTFPEEAKYKDLEYADRAYSIFVSDILKSPTTRVSAFGTLHKDATLLLAKKLSKAGLSGYVGKVNMDRNSPDILIENTEESYHDTIEFIEKMNDIENIKPIITPRFIPSCTDELLTKLGSLVQKYNLPVQSHLSENKSEIQWVQKLVPESKCYADAYAKFGLWGNTPTIMAHCTWSKEKDKSYMDNPNIFIAHCPDSNANLTSGVAAAKYFLDNGNKIGLGSDIAAGTSLYITRAITDSIKASKLRQRLMNEDNSTLTFPEAFYMASVGGGEFFGNVGTFSSGFDADFVILDESGLDSTLIRDFSIEERLERYCYLAGERPVTHKFVKGRFLF